MFPLPLNTQRELNRSGRLRQTLLLDVPEFSDHFLGRRETSRSIDFAGDIATAHRRVLFETERVVGATTTAEFYSTLQPAERANDAKADGLACIAMRASGAERRDGAGESRQYAFGRRGARFDVRRLFPPSMGDSTRDLGSIRFGSLRAASEARE